MHTQNNKPTPQVCPKTGISISPKENSGIRKFLFPITGLIALIWFLIRVIPKPSRAAYPCQRIAAPLAASFVIWLTGVLSSLAFLRKAKSSFAHASYKIAALYLVIGLLLASILPLNYPNSKATAAYHIDPPNSPMGVARGIYPGRVSWVYDPTAAIWDGITGNWWDEANTNQSVVDDMLSRTLQSLSGTSDDADAWNAIFHYFNQQHGRGNVGYSSGETIVVKINMNDGRDGHPSNNYINAVSYTHLTLPTKRIV